MTKKMPEHDRDARTLRRAFIVMMWRAYNSSLEWSDIIAIMFKELLFFYRFFNEEESPERWGGDGERTRGLRMTSPDPQVRHPKMKLPQPGPDA